jgi:hypothetical protein
MSQHKTGLFDKENNNDMAVTERNLQQTYFPSILPDLEACSSANKVDANVPQRYFTDVFLDDNVVDQQSGLACMFYFFFIYVASNVSSAARLCIPQINIGTSSDSSGCQGERYVCFAFSLFFFLFSIHRISPRGQRTVKVLSRVSEADNSGTVDLNTFSKAQHSSTTNCETHTHTYDNDTVCL